MFTAMEAGLASGDFEAQQLNGVLDALTASEDYLKFLKYVHQIQARKKWAQEILPAGDKLFDFGDD